MNVNITGIYDNTVIVDRLAAAGRLRSAVALELAAGKVWALPKTVQIQLVGSSGATARATLNGLGATARAPVAASHHACGREELLRCWADSETRLQGAGVPSIPSLLKTERRGRGLDPVARDNLADSLMAQGQRCLPYPNSTRPSQSVMGGRPPHGAGRQPVIAESPPSPGGMLNHPRDTALERLSSWIRNTGEAASAPCRARANRCCVHTTAEGDSDGSHSDAGPLGTATPMGLQAVPVDLPAGRPPATPGTAGPPRVRDVRPPRRTRATCTRPSGWQVLQVFQSVAMTVTDHPYIHSESARLDPKRLPFPPG